MNSVVGSRLGVARDIYISATHGVGGTRGVVYLMNAFGDSGFGRRRAIYCASAESGDNGISHCPRTPQQH